MGHEPDSHGNITSLRKEAKRWLRALRAGDAEARRRFERFHPDPPAAPGLREVQHALARSHGCAGWSELTQLVEDQALARRTHAERVAEFLELACLSYGMRPGSTEWRGHIDSPARRRQAARILQRHPEVAHDSVHAAVVAGDLAEVERLLARSPGLATARSGPQEWEPLLFLCYGRLPVAAASDNAVAIARLLLDRGASPDTQWTWIHGPERQVMRWPALCGVIGEGEAGIAQLPPHPRADELARLLLERGADPNQSQALYNTMFEGDDPRWLRLLIAHGLDAASPTAWEAPGGTGTIFQYLLAWAVGHHQLARAAVLLEHGADATAGGTQALWRTTAMAGDAAMARLLEAHGARPVPLEGSDAFCAACMAGDEATARRLLAEHPDYLEHARRLLVERAPEGDRVEIVRLLLGLGVEPDAATPGNGYRALNRAVGLGSLRVAELLLARGADPDGRDGTHHGTPLGWAHHAACASGIRLMVPRSRDLGTLVANGHLDRVRELLAGDPDWARAVSSDLLFSLPDDDDQAVEMVDALLAAGADPRRRDAQGRAAADAADARGLAVAAETLREAAETDGRA